MSANGPMAGRVCVVTGATLGIGYETALGLARAGASVAVVGRAPARVSEATARITAAVPNGQVRGFVADLFLQADVRRLAAEITGTYPQVHVLVNNAGAVFSTRAVTAEGFERTWALNVVTPFLLTHLLLPQLQASAPGRLVNVSSMAHRGVTLEFENLQGENHYSAFGAYSRSKLALVLMTYEFARRLGDSHVTVNALHPGFVSSGFGKNNPGAFGGTIGFFSFLFGIRPPRGARTSIFLASDPSVEHVTGKYFARRREVASSPASYDPATGARLWDVLSLQTGIPADLLERPR
jgi:NAD(P)-dependent dehydrogenase (short-subunit alcohol dehydrogenase family)